MSASQQTQKHYYSHSKTGLESNHDLLLIKVLQGLYSLRGQLKVLRMTSTAPKGPHRHQRVRSILPRAATLPRVLDSHMPTLLPPSPPSYLLNCCLLKPAPGDHCGHGQVHIPISPTASSLSVQLTATQCPTRSLACRVLFVSLSRQKCFFVCFFGIFLLSLFSVLGIEPKALCM